MPTKSPYKRVSTRGTLQTEAIPGREKDMTENSAGGYSFKLDAWGTLDRFLILGTDGGTYYISEKELTLDRAKMVIKLVQDPKDGPRVVDRIVEVSTQGLALKQEPAIFALAIAAGMGDEDTRKKAMEALPKVCRTATHLYTFVEFVEQFRGWGAMLRKGVAAWYNDKPLDKLVYQLLKYKSRGGWSHRDLLRLSHPKTADPIRNEAYQFALGKLKDFDHAQVQAVRTLHSPERMKKSDVDAPTLIRTHRLTREMVPSEALKDAKVWDALLDQMPMMAMVRNLGQMSSVGLLKPFEPSVKTVVDRLQDEELLKGARLHPLFMLNALYNYKAGSAMKGKLSWAPVPQVIEALEKSFYLAFKTVEPTGKRMMLGIDVSGSMCGPNIPGTRLSPREASAVLAMATARVEPNHFFLGFASRPRPLEVTASQRLDDVVRYFRSQSFGRTDCAAPMLYALKEGLKVDTFCIYTDSETWVGDIHPIQALQKYREKTGIDSRLVVVGMVANNFTIADPKDPGMLDVVGFDTSLPATISKFAKGQL